MPFDDSISIADCKELIKPCHYWVEKMSNFDRTSIAHSIDSVLSDWRALHRSQQGDEVPLFHDPKGPDGYALDVAFRLWVDDDPGFSEIIAEYGLPTVFAWIGVMSGEATTHALVRLNGLLVGLLLDKLEVAVIQSQYYSDADRERREKGKESIKEAQRIASEKKKQKAIRVQAQYRQAAYKYMFNSPTARQPALLDHLQSLELEKVNKLPDRPAETQPARGTIKRLIAGVMEEARKAPRSRPSLYATDPKHSR